MLRPLLSFVLIAVLCSGCGLITKSPLATDNVHLTLGNPSHALRLDPARYHLFMRPQYALLYDRTSSSPTWASWQLNEAWLGQLSRPLFAPEPNLPAGWPVVVPRDYTGSGFDRGHIVPAADRNRTAEDSAAVFYMTNIVPQAPDNNRGPWEALESYCRRLAHSGKELYIVAGPVGQGGGGSLGAAQAIGNGKITVPAALWKVIVVNSQPGLGLSGVTQSTRVIAVLMPNQQGIKTEDWRLMRTTVRELEQRTGYDFLSNVPQSIQDILETRIDQL